MLTFQHGANIKAVSQHVGCGWPSITMDLYAPLLPEQRQDVSDKIDALFFDS